MIGAQTLEQGSDEDSVTRRIRAHHSRQRAELGIDVFDLGSFDVAGELGFPRKGAVEGNKVEVGKSSGGPREIVGVTILFDEYSRQALVHTDVLDAVPTEHFE